MNRKHTMVLGMVTRPVTLLCSRLEPAMQANMATMTALDFAEEPSLSVDADRTSIWMARLFFRVSQ